jgi:hypothetical protein
MSDRSLIFSTKGVQIGYIEGDRAFDLRGMERCKYARATGNLSELNSDKIIGYVSLDGTFVGLSWISGELFGRPSGEVHLDRTVLRRQPPHLRPLRAKLRPTEKLGVKEPKDVSLLTATAPQPELEPSPAVSKFGGYEETKSNSERVADEVPLPQGEPIVGAALDPSKSSSTENELLGRAIGMIRNALEKEPE